jgi:hypothetical protein
MYSSLLGDDRYPETTLNICKKPRGFLEVDHDHQLNHPRSESTVILMASINDSGGANLKTVIASGRVPGIADRQSVSAAFAQRLNAALTASKTTVKQLHAVVIG